MTGRRICGHERRVPPAAGGVRLRRQQRVVGSHRRLFSAEGALPRTGGAHAPAYIPYVLPLSVELLLAEFL